MWKLRLQEMQSVDDSRHYHHHQLQQRIPAQLCEVRRQECSSRRRMSMGDLRSERPTTEGRGLFDSLPRLFSRLIASFSQSLAFLAPPLSSDELTSINCSSSSSSSISELQHVSLDDEVD